MRNVPETAIVSTLSAAPAQCEGEKLSKFATKRLRKKPGYNALTAALGGVFWKSIIQKGGTGLSPELDSDRCAERRIPGAVRGQLPDNVDPWN